MQPWESGRWCIQVTPVLGGQRPGVAAAAAAVQTRQQQPDAKRTQPQTD